MSCTAPLRGSAAAAALLAFSAGAAQAELTAEAVWEAWQASLTDAGQAVEAAETRRDGDTLFLRGLSIGATAEGVALATAIDEVAFTETSDGTVSVRMSDAYALSVTGDDGSAAVFGISHPGLRLEVGESDTGLRHRITAPEVTVTLDELAGPDAPERFDLRLEMTRLTGAYDVARDAGAPTSADLGIGALELRSDIRDAGDHLDLDYRVTGLTLRFAGAGLDQADRLEVGDMAGALAEGLAIELQLDFDTQRYAAVLEEDGERTNVSGSAMSGGFRFVLDATELALQTSSRNGELTLAGPDLPMPELSLRSSEITYGLRLPTSAAAEPQPVSLLVRVVEAVAPEAVWAMADPEGALPRGPVTAVLDLAGQVVLPADLFGMETMFGAMMGGPFAAVQPTALEIRELVLRAAGAELTGVGDFTLDPTDLDTFDGFPRPEGRLDLSLTGGNTLIDTLVAMGMLPADQANAARMVLALFARPGEGPDQLRSTIELREGGAVYANDMRLQ